MSGPPRNETDNFLPSSRLEISDAALALAQTFAEELHQGRPGDWVLCFDWAISREIRHRDRGGWQDLGPGVDLTAYERKDLPAGAINRIAGLELALKIPASLVAGKSRLDVDRVGDATVFVLR
jgi:hypothetical protein